MQAIEHRFADRPCAPGRRDAEGGEAIRPHVRER
jgi:hypothetical protein